MKQKKLDEDHIRKIDARVDKEYPDRKPFNLAAVLALPGFKTKPKKKKKDQEKKT